MVEGRAEGAGYQLAAFLARLAPARSGREAGTLRRLAHGVSRRLSRYFYVQGTGGYHPPCHQQLVEALGLVFKVFLGGTRLEKKSLDESGVPLTLLIFKESLDS